MATQFQLRRGTSQEIDNFTGAESELIANTETNELTVHDGTTKGGHVVLGENRISNCITEIPQDIKLELNNGTLTLKAGSKVYVPNGAGVFTPITITSDCTVSQTVNDKHCVYVNTAQQLWVKKLSGFVSGDTTPSAINDGIWYNTTGNRIEWYNGSAWSGDGGRSFPIAIVTVSNGAISSIDQVFNGFGYVGSTVFALPGVKGLAPNGRNADGTLKSVVIAPNSVITRTFDATGALYIGLQATGFGGIVKSNYEYNLDTNIQYSSRTAFSNSIVFASCDMSDGAISNWTVLKNNPFRAVDYSDTEYIAHQAALGSRYVDFTPAAYGPNYKMPGDGYFYANYTLPDSNNHMLRVYATDSNITLIPLAQNEIVANWTGPYVVNGAIAVIIPVRKDQYVHVSMFNDEKPTTCRFVYINGSK